MTQKTYSVVFLKAEEGMWLTDNNNIIEANSIITLKESYEQRIKELKEYYEQ